MGRKRKPGFTQMKMLASRVEESDYYKFESLIELTGKSLQQVVNLFVVNYISGNISLEGSKFVVRTNNDEST